VLRIVVRAMAGTRFIDADMLRLSAGGMTFAALAWGPPDGPLALCLHGYPDTARTWRYLGPHLAVRGWRVVAPYSRGYAPTDLSPDGNYQLGALARDVLELHRALGGDGRAVLIGHDWGAGTAYIVGAHRPKLFRRIVTIAVAPAPVLLSPFRSPSQFVSDLPLIARQLRFSWYMFFQLLPGISERTLPRVIPRLWADWSPGYDAREDVAHVFAALDGPGRATAALRYYRAFFLPWMRRREYAAEQGRMFDVPPVPLLYLHGERDGCQLPAIARRATELLPFDSRFELVPDAGHFLHLERPEDVNERIASFIATG
jgi:pimeloyl-ACP methyl ester carboxylesterase